MGNFLSLGFWLNLRPGSLEPIYQKYFIGFILFLFIITFVFWLAKFRKKNLYTAFRKKLYSFSLINAFIGLVLLFFNYELIPFLSARFWFLLWAAGIIVWLFFIFKILAIIPKQKKLLKEEREYKKYIP